MEELLHGGAYFRNFTVRNRYLQGSNKVSSGNLGPVDFLAGQVTITVHLPQASHLSVILLIIIELLTDTSKRWP